jgi:succinate dehydrogenase (ubiquinone) cytochrome b560 subunit
VTVTVCVSGVTGIGALSLVGVDVPTLMSTIGDLTVLGTVAKVAVSFPLVYHYLGGIRHLYWDRFPDTLNNEDVEKLSYALAGSAAVISLGIAMI